MTTKLYSNSPFIQVRQQGSSYINPNSYNSPGALRYNTSTNNLEYFDGSMWLNISTSYEIAVGYELETTINWVRDRMNKERIWREKAIKFPTMADALKSYEDAQAKLDVLAELCQEEEPAQKAA